MSDASTETELNRLYWETDASVSEIADQLDISRRTLYDGIEPRPAGERCPECGAPLGFRNRTALENGEAECPACGYETEVAESTVRAAAEGSTTAGGPTQPRTRRLPPAGSGPALGTAFVAGLLVGALVTYLSERH